MSAFHSWVIAFGVTLLSGPAFGQDALGEQRSMVVMLQTADAEGRAEGSMCAAALMLSSSGGRTLLLTANHVLDALDAANDDRKQAHLPPLKLTAQFANAVGHLYDLRPLAGLSSARLDYAVVEVVPQPGSPIVAPRSWAVLGLVEDPIKSSSSGNTVYQEVRAIGNNACQPWLVSASTEKVITVTGTDIVFETRFVDKGNSGGGLFAADGGLIGMVIETTGDKGTATQLSLIANELQAKHVVVDWTTKDYSALGEDSVTRGRPYADIVTQKSVRAALRSASGSSAAFRLLPESLPPYASEKALLGGGKAQDADNDFYVSIKDVLAGGQSVRLTFVDGTSKVLPVDLKASLMTKVNEMSGQQRDWFSYSGSRGHLNFIPPSQDESALVKSADIGFAPNALEHHLSRDDTIMARDNLLSSAELNGLTEHTNLLVPIGTRKFWYKVNFVNGASTPVHEQAIPDNELFDRSSYNYEGIHVVRSKEGVIFPYSYAYFQQPNPELGGMIVLHPPYGIQDGGELQFDVDGRGFVDASKQNLLWTTKPIRVRYFNSSTGKTVGPFSLPGFDVSAIRDGVLATFPQIRCKRTQPPGRCEVSNPKLLGQIRALRYSFTSESALHAAKLADFLMQVSNPEGRWILHKCENSSQPDCSVLKQQLGLSWEIPPSAKDFFYSVTMVDGRTLPVQRILLDQ